MNVSRKTAALARLTADELIDGRLSGRVGELYAERVMRKVRRELGFQECVSPSVRASGKALRPQAGTDGSEVQP